ncbi:MAG: hypothetical protein J6W80_04890, partial [Kiritimatiellae bacterium]|nr:hypothetical protein [Kiritimatiellia bacterium]
GFTSLPERFHFPTGAKQLPRAGARGFADKQQNKGKTMTVKYITVKGQGGRGRIDVRDIRGERG